MKRLKKLASLILALVMVLAMSVPAFAENENRHTITITYKNSGHEYTAYQVFKGDITDGKLANIEWGAGVNGSALLAELKKNSSYAACTDARDVADVLAGFQNDSEELEAFSRVVEEHLTETSAGTSQIPVKNNDEKYVYTINVTGDGYYFVKDTGTIAGGDAATKYILKVTGDININAKADAPGLDKKIKEKDEEGNPTTTTTTTNNAAIGDTVYFELTSKVPEMDGYDHYYFVVNDTLSKGLTFKDDIAIKIGDKTLTRATSGDTNGDYTVTSTPVTDSENKATGETAIKIIFKNFIQYKEEDVGKPITINYSATVNENAVIGTAGNPNTATLTYSNDPNVEEDGTSGDEPGPGSPTGKTPESKTITYVTGIILTKVDTEPEPKPLADAEFELTGTKLNTVLVTSQKYTEDTAGTYYKLKDGSYTTEEPNGKTEHDSVYASTTTKYSVETVNDEKVTKTENVHYTAITDSTGVIKFTGLSAGTYTITELKAPAGYNKLEKPLEFTISWEAPEAGNTACTWNVADTDGNNPSGAKVENGIITLTVVNRAGAVLPSTGGIGTTIFYVIGSILVIGAAVLLVTKKRMKSEKQ